MKLADLIEQAEEALEVVIAVDNLDELQRYFGNYATEINES